MKRHEEIAICRDNAAGHVTYIQGAVNQSMADENGVSLADYIHAIFGLLLQAKPRHVLLIGCGGGTLATMLRASDVRVTMLDINPTSFAIAREHFHLPKSVACHVADGRTFLRRSTRRYDAVVLDAYAGKQIPGHFLTSGFMRLVKAHLRGENACFAINVIAKRLRDPYVRKVSELMKTTWRDVRILGSKEGGHHNAIVIAGAVADLQRPRPIMLPRIGRGALRAGLAQMIFRD